jgi:hypothetical protein
VKTMLEMIERPEYAIRAALYFIEGGHYLFRTFEGRGRSDADVSKFVRSTDVAAAFVGQELDTGWLPAGLVRMGYAACGPWFVYSAPGQKVTTWLGENERVEIPIPRTVLMGAGSNYYLFAQRGKHVDVNGALYHAPFPNVYPSGRICWGRNTPGEALAENARRVWDMFFEAPFNGDLCGGKCVSQGSDVRELLRSWKDKNKFPEDELIGGERRKLGEAADRLIREGSL